MTIKFVRQNLCFTNRACHRRLTHLWAEGAGPRLVRFELLADDGEVGLVCGQSQHDEVRVGATQTVVGVGVVGRLAALPPDVVHYLVLALAGHVGVRQDHLDAAPAGVGAEAHVDVVTQAVGQPEHEGRALWYKGPSTTGLTQGGGDYTDPITISQPAGTLQLLVYHRNDSKLFIRFVHLLTADLTPFRFRSYFSDHSSSIIIIFFKFTGHYYDYATTWISDYDYAQCYWAGGRWWDVDYWPGWCNCCQSVRPEPCPEGGSLRVPSAPPWSAPCRPSSPYPPITSHRHTVTPLQDHSETKLATLYR